jgi:hypothetical protein
MKLILVARKAFAASLIISADATSTRRTGASIFSCKAAARSPSCGSNAPMTMRSGFMKSRTAVPSARNSGLET